MIMIEEPFGYRDSPIHGLDPRLRLIFAALFSFVVALSLRFSTLMVALALSVLMIGLSKVSLLKVARRLLVVNGLILFLWIVLPLTFEGTPVFYVGPAAVAREGILLCAQMTLKSNAILLMFVGLVATMPIATLGHAMERLRMPSKIIHLFLITYRYLFVMEQEYQRLVRAAKVRGFRPNTNMNTYRTYAYLIGMLFVRASARAERVYQAMICRGFEGRFYCLGRSSFKRTDWAWCGLMAAILLGLVGLEWRRVL